MREGALELFAESVALHEPLLPVCGEEDLGGWKAVNAKFFEEGTGIVPQIQAATGKSQ